MFELIHLETNKYAIQKNESTPNISYSEIQQYIGILIFMDVVKMPLDYIGLIIVAIAKLQM